MALMSSYASTLLPLYQKEEENMVDITPLMILIVITLVVYLDFAHQLICNDFMMALDCQRRCKFIPIELQVRRY
jgi:hypothetical protein